MMPPQPEGVGLRNGMPLKWHLVKNEKTVNIQPTKHAKDAKPLSFKEEGK
jgi:hypothetical protein